MRSIPEVNGKTLGTMATLILTLLALGVAIYSTYRFLSTAITVLSEGQDPSKALLQYTLYLPALIPLTASALILVGLLWHKLPLTWLGWFVLAVFGILFLFSMGGTLLPIVVLLLAGLTILQFQRLAFAWFILLAALVLSVLIHFDWAVIFLIGGILVLTALTFSRLALKVR